MSKRNYRGRKRPQTDLVLNQSIGKKIKEARLSRVVLIEDKNTASIGKECGITFKVSHLVDKKKLCTQTELANALNPPKTFQQIQKYEKGKNGVSTIILLQISKFFNKPLEYFTSEATELLGQENPPNNNPTSTAPSLDKNGINLKSDFH